MANSIFLFPGSINFSGDVTANRVLVGDGTAAAPSIAFANNPDTGLYNSSTGNNEIGISLGGAQRAIFQGSLPGFILDGNTLLGWGSSGTASPDTIILRDAANTLALRNGTNTQEMRIGPAALYVAIGSTNTGVSYVRSVGNTALVLGTVGTNRWDILNTGHFVADTDNTYDIGASGATRPRTGYFGTSLKAPLVSALGANAQESKILQATAQSAAMAGATATLANLIPAGSLVLGVTVHPTTAITSGDGATTYNVGDGTDADRWGLNILFAADVKLTDITITSPPYYAAATSVVLTANAGTFNAGVVRVTVHYITLVAATS